MGKSFAGISVLMLLLGAPSAEAAPQPPKPAKQVPPPPPACNPQASADYVPGIDVKGRPVAPADLPSGSDIVVSTTVYPEIRSPNPLAPRTGLSVRIDGLGQPPRNCLPAATAPPPKP
jgi:hypothetical protein